jgi:hypothetical protein
MGTPESKVKAKLKQLLRDKGRYWFMPVQTGYGSTTLDFLVCSDDGHFVAYECKAEGRKLTPRQELVARQITNAGGDAYKVTLVNGELEFELCGLTKNEGS